MSKDSYNALNVPWYAPSDMPAIDRSPNAGEDVHDETVPEQKTRLTRQAERMQFIRDTFRSVQRRFPPGSRFILREYKTDVDAFRQQIRTAGGLDQWKQLGSEIPRQTAEYRGTVLAVNGPPTIHNSGSVHVQFDPGYARDTKSSYKARFTPLMFRDALRVTRLPIVPATPYALSMRAHRWLMAKVYAEGSDHCSREYRTFRKLYVCPFEFDLMRREGLLNLSTTEVSP